MAFCGKCGTQVENGVQFCPGCGSQVSNNQGQQTANQYANQQNVNAQAPVANNYSTAGFDQADVEQNKIMGILAYLSWLVLVPLFAAPKSPYARFHANQGLVLAITEIAWWIIQTILSSIIISISWTLFFVPTILSLVNILFLVLAIIGIVNALNGQAKELPIIGKFRILK